MKRPRRSSGGRPSDGDRRERQPEVVQGPPRRGRQRVLPEVDAEQYRGFLDLSSGIPTATTCPKCGYSW